MQCRISSEKECEVSSLSGCVMGSLRSTLRFEESRVLAIGLLVQVGNLTLVSDL